jgi:aspartyl-tRNA(Asn)/glutamyl-tRNA(Gln) amidotransferase subunit C
MLEVNEPHAAGAERGGVLGAIEDREPEHVAIETGDPVEVAHLKADRADMERGATGEGGGGGRIWCIHDGYIDPSGKPRNSALTAGCRRKSCSAIGSLSLVRCGSAPMSVDATTVRRIAHLARIAVADDEVEHLRGELNAILAFVEQLSEVDVEGVEPMTSVTPMEMKKRPDVVTDGGIPDDVIKNAPAAQDGFFVVPKVVE